LFFQPIPTTIKKALQEFKRTHQDNWQVDACPLLHFYNLFTFFPKKIEEVSDLYFENQNSNYLPSLIVWEMGG
jgi:hypothetical protein